MLRLQNYMNDMFGMEPWDWFGDSDLYIQTLAMHHDGAWGSNGYGVPIGRFLEFLQEEGPQKTSNTREFGRHADYELTRDAENWLDSKLGMSWRVEAQAQQKWERGVVSMKSVLKRALRRR